MSVTKLETAFKVSCSQQTFFRFKIGSQRDLPRFTVAEVPGKIRSSALRRCCGKLWGCTTVRQNGWEQTAGPKRLRALGAQAALQAPQRAQAGAKMPKKWEACILATNLRTEKIICTQSTFTSVSFFCRGIRMVFPEQFPSYATEYWVCLWKLCHSSLPATSGVCMSGTILFFSGVLLAAPFWEMPGGTMPRIACQLISEDWALCHLN